MSWDEANDFPRICYGDEGATFLLHPDINFLGDDEHKAWAKVQKALASAFVGENSVMSNGSLPDSSMCRFLEPAESQNRGDSHKAFSGRTR